MMRKSPLLYFNLKKVVCLYAKAKKIHNYFYNISTNFIIKHKFHRFCCFFALF